MSKYSIHFTLDAVVLEYILCSLCQRRHSKQVKFIPVARQYWRINSILK